MADDTPPDSSRPPARAMGLRVVARHSAGRHGGRALAREVAESHRPEAPRRVDAALAHPTSTAPPAPPAAARAAGSAGPRAAARPRLRLRRRRAAAPAGRRPAASQRPDWAPPA